MVKNKIAFIHPDLGIGGAERAIVDAAMALKLKDYHVTIFTNHHEVDHCFEETINGDLNVITVGTFIPRSFFGMCCALFAYIRMVFAACYLILYHYNDFDLIYVDQITAPIPLLKLFNYKVLFYAHFPDMLLSKRRGFLKRLYRLPIDFTEKFSLSFADIILFNSKFTGETYRKHFRFLKDTEPTVLYPVPNIDNLISSNSSLPIVIDDNSKMFLSINRYERKKDIDLGLKAFALLRSDLIKSNKETKLIFVHFGGYDELVSENHELYEELDALIDTLQIRDSAFLLKSCSNDVKVNFLKRATALLYTPSNEHFGIVPIEAMFLKCPVISVNSGGPLETVIDGKTGFLCESEPEQFKIAMKRLIMEPNLKNEIGEAGYYRVIKDFSFRTFQESLTRIVSKLIE